MIPLLFIAGLVIGLLPRWLPIAGVVLAAIAWTLFWGDDDLLQTPTDAAFVFAWGLASLAVGALIARTAKRLIATDIQNRKR